MYRHSKSEFLQVTLNSELKYIVRRQAKSRVFLMIKVATKVIIVLQGRKYHFIFGGKISGRSKTGVTTTVRSHGGQISYLVKSVQNCY